MIIYLIDKPDFDHKTQCALCGKKRTNNSYYYGSSYWKPFDTHWEWTGQFNENAGDFTKVTIVIPSEAKALFFCGDCFATMCVPTHLGVMSKVTGWELK